MEYAVIAHLSQAGPFCSKVFVISQRQAFLSAYEIYKAGKNVKVYSVSSTQSTSVEITGLLSLGPMQPVR